MISVNQSCFFPCCPSQWRHYSITGGDLLLPSPTISILSATFSPAISISQVSSPTFSQVPVTNCFSDFLKCFSHILNLLKFYIWSIFIPGRDGRFFGIFPLGWWVGWGENQKCSSWPKMQKTSFLFYEGFPKGRFSIWEKIPNNPVIFFWMRTLILSLFSLSS